MSLPNVWHHRKVADGSAKACWICYKLSTSVLITPDSKDFFYICIGHLKDRGFCQADQDEVKAAEEKKRKEELDGEIEKVKLEYEEKKKRKGENKKQQKSKDKDKDKDTKQKEEEEDKADEKEKDETIKRLSDSKASSQDDEGPRIYSLQKNFHQMRLDRIRSAEIAKRNRERLKNPANFPSVPSNDL